VQANVTATVIIVIFFFIFFMCMRKESQYHAQRMHEAQSRFPSNTVYVKYILAVICIYLQTKLQQLNFFNLIISVQRALLVSKDHQL